MWKRRAVAVSALVGSICFGSVPASGQQLFVSRSTTEIGTTWLRLSQEGDACFQLDASRIVVAPNSITIETADHQQACFPEPPPSSFDLAIDLGHLPDGHYTVTWSFDAPLRWPTSTAEFDVHAATDHVTEYAVTEFSLSPGPDARPNGIAAGSDGNLWITEINRNRIARVSPLGGITEFTAGISPGALPWEIAAGPDGNLWFTEPGINKIGRITPLGVVTEFGVGSGEFVHLIGIAAGPDGNMWFADTQGKGIGRITTSGVVTEFNVSPGAIGITAGSDGNVWFTQVDRIGRITPSGVVTEFSVGVTVGSNPSGITLGPDGNVWFTENAGNRIGRITPLGVVTEFSAGISPSAGPYAITAGPDGNLWFTEPGGRIGRITPTGVVTEIEAGITGGPQEIVAGPDGNLWFTEGPSQIGQVITGVPIPTVVAVEYYYSAWNYYFETSSPDEIAALDGGAFGGAWKRTGQTFNVWPQANPNSSPTCRFFSTGFAPKSTHVYTPFASECASLKASSAWQYEGIAFHIQQANTNGLCTNGTIPLYRLYNNGMGGAPNHRYTTSQTILDQMIAAGWIFEGNGNTKVFACVPQ